MINNRFRTIVSTAVLASGLGLIAVGVAGTANAIPVNFNPPQAVCHEIWSDGTYFYYYC